MSADILIRNGLGVQDGRIIDAASARIMIDSTGLDILPGLIDVHGDAFERAIAPRPGVTFPIGIALAEFEAQLLACGITTALLAITLSWEAGLRSRATYEKLRDAVLARPAGSVPDLRLHVRFEAHNLADLDLLIADIEAGHIAMLSFNDHTPGIVRKLGDPASAAKFVDRAGQSIADFSRDALAAAALDPAAIAAGREKLGRAAVAAGIAIASHDDDTLAVREKFRALGAAISEFPMTLDVAQAAMDAGEYTVMGAPNVVRGGSHLGWHGAEALVKLGLCSVLCSDYHYPSLLNAAYRIANNASASFDQAVALVSRNAAKMSLLEDRGTLRMGQRADIILVDPGAERNAPRVVAVIAGGKLAYLAPGEMARVSQV